MVLHTVYCCVTFDGFLIGLSLCSQAAPSSTARNDQGGKIHYVERVWRNDFSSERHSETAHATETLRGGNVARCYHWLHILIRSLGLVIAEAIYWLTEQDEEAKSLAVDVTDALQALVHTLYSWA